MATAADVPTPADAVAQGKAAIGQRAGKFIEDVMEDPLKAVGCVFALCPCLHISPKVKRRVTLYLIGTTALVVTAAYLMGMGDVMEERYREKQQLLLDFVNNNTVTEDARPPPTNDENAIASACIGAMLGPVLLIYGYQVQATIVVLNALMTSGIKHFFQMVRRCAAAAAAAADVAGAAGARNLLVILAGA